jgi:hypothetical protein
MSAGYSMNTEATEAARDGPADNSSDTDLLRKTGTFL